MWGLILNRKVRLYKDLNKVWITLVSCTPMGELPNISMLARLIILQLKDGQSDICPDVAKQTPDKKKYECYMGGGCTLSAPGQLRYENLGKYCGCCPTEHMITRVLVLYAVKTRLTHNSLRWYLFGVHSGNLYNSNLEFKRELVPCVP